MKDSEVLEMELEMTKALEKAEEDPRLRKMPDERLKRDLLETTVRFAALWREADRRTGRETKATVACKRNWSNAKA